MAMPIGRFLVFVSVFTVTIGASAATPDKALPPLDLQQPFAARSPWRLTAKQDSPVEDPSGDIAPGRIVLCLTRDSGRNCDPGPNLALRLPGSDDAFSQPHFLRRAEIVRMPRQSPLLLIELASFHAGNGDQRRSLQLYGYDRASDTFRLAYGHRTGRNNNQEMRYVESGALGGAMITADPTTDAPFAYWIAVSRPDAVGRYKQDVRFRSATIYGDGNPLAVIDSEMPNILKRLGLWRPGMDLPLPAAPCPRPHLANEALWCR